MISAWVRLYAEIIDDPKMAMLPDAQFRLFCEALCLAKVANSRGDTCLTVEQLDWRLRRKTAKNVEALCSLGVLFMTEAKTVAVTKWDARQFESDSSTGRVAKHRAKHKGNVSVTADETLHGTLQVTNETVSVTPPDTDTDTDTEQRVETPLRGSPKATRLPDDWSLPDEWATEASEIRQAGGLTPLNIPLEAEKFRDYWCGKSGKDATKRDWRGTWRNWVRNAYGPKPAQSAQSDFDDWMRRTGHASN